MLSIKTTYQLFCKLLLMLVVILSATSCQDDDSFSLSQGNILTMGRDTVKLGTVFAGVPAPGTNFFVKNNSGDGIRCKEIRLQRGNQSGFRVNVDGSWLSDAMGYKVGNVEVRKGDSICVFVEVTAPKPSDRDTIYDPRQIEDNLVFTLESGVKQVVNLNAMSWNADVVNTLVVTTDSMIDNAKARPLIVMDSIVVAQDKSLEIKAGSRIFFQNNAGIKVHGTLVAHGDSTANILLRGNRIDNMFDYLPYDNLAGQWRGIHFYPTSYNNVIDYTDIHGCYDGIVCDSSSMDKPKLQLTNSIIHNCQGYGLYTVNNRMTVENTQISNTLNDCVCIIGGNVSFNNCTIAQFFPLNAVQSPAVYLTNRYGDYGLNLDSAVFRNSIITGYGSDVLSGDSIRDSSYVFSYAFRHCLLRTPVVESHPRYTNIIWDVEPKNIREEEDTIPRAELHFKLIDSHNMVYDFHLDSISPCRGSADPKTALPLTREGIKRDEEQPDLGCY